MKEYFKYAVNALNKNIIVIFILVLFYLVDYFFSNLILSKLATAFIGTGSNIISMIGYLFFAKIVSGEKPLSFAKIFKQGFSICCRLFLIIATGSLLLCLILLALQPTLSKVKINPVNNPLYYLLHYTLLGLFLIFCVAAIYILPWIFLKNKIISGVIEGIKFFRRNIRLNLPLVALTLFTIFNEIFYRNYSEILKNGHLSTQYLVLFVKVFVNKYISILVFIIACRILIDKGAINTDLNGPALLNKEAYEQN